MKEAWIAIILFFITGSIACRHKQGIRFLSQNTSWKKLLQKAKEAHKPIFIDIYTTWCAPCKKMEQEVFPLPAVGKLFNDRFINIEYNGDAGTGKQINDRFKVRAYPTFLFISPRGNLVMRSTGGMNENDFIRIGKEVLSKILASKPLSEWEEEYQRNKSNPEFILNYIRKKRSLQLPVQDEVEAYLDLLPADSFNTPLVTHLVTWNDISLFGKAFQVLRKMYQEDPYSLELTAPRLSMEDVFSNYIRRAIKTKDTVMFCHIIDTMKTTYRDPGVRARIIGSASIRFYAGINDTTAFIVTAKNYIKQFLTTVNPDSLHNRDQNRLNKILQFKFGTIHADSTKNYKKFNKYKKIYQNEADHITEDVIFICQYICRIAPYDRDKKLSEKALQWLKTVSGLEERKNKGRLSSIISCLESS